MTVADSRLGEAPGEQRDAPREPWMPRGPRARTPDEKTASFARHGDYTLFHLLLATGIRSGSAVAIQLRR